MTRSRGPSARMSASMSGPMSVPPRRTGAAPALLLMLAALLGAAATGSLGLGAPTAQHVLFADLLIALAGSALALRLSQEGDGAIRFGAGALVLLMLCYLIIAELGGMSSFWRTLTHGLLSLAGIAALADWPHRRLRRRNRQTDLPAPPFGVGPDPAAMIDALGTATFVFDAQKTLVFSNDAARALATDGADPAHWLRSTPFHALDQRRPLDSATHPFDAMASGGAPVSSILGHLAPDGSERALHLRAVNLETGPDGPPLRLVTITDETALWILRGRVSHDDRMDSIGQAAGRLSHQLSTLMGVIRITADTALMRDDPGTLHRLVDTIRTACERGAELTERLSPLSLLGQTEVATDPIPASVAGASDDPAAPLLDGVRVLMIEDDPHFRDILVESLILIGAHVVSAESAEAVLEHLRSGQVFDLLLTDIALGGDDNGFDLARAAAQLRPDLRVIYMTGYSDITVQAPKDVPGLVHRKTARLSTLHNTILLSMAPRP